MALTTWFISRAGQQHGPITQEEFRKFVELGHLKPDDLVWHDGATDWMPGASFLDQRTADAAGPPASSVAQGTRDVGPTTGEKEQTPARKSWINGIAILWGLIILVMIVVSVAEPKSIPYRVAGAINGAIFGGIAGAVAGMLQYLIQKKLTATPISIAIALGFIAGQVAENSINFFGGRFYEQSVRPRVTQEVFSRQLDDMPIYQAMKRADPEAYSQLRSEVAKRVADGADGNDIEIYTQTYTASFRRAKAEAALSAPPEALATLMQTLRDILDHLHSRDDSLCAEYIVQAFASERIRALVRETDFSALVQRNATAVFDAIAEGLKHKRTYQALTEADIQLAIQGLQARRWSDEMRAAMAEPSKLSTLPPELVCRVHRDWFATLASLPDPARTRWYREVLGPLLRS